MNNEFLHWIYIHYGALDPVPLQIALYVKGVNGGSKATQLSISIKQPPLTRLLSHQ